MRFPRKKLVARRSVASAFTNEQQSRSVTFYGKEEQRSEQTARFTAAASDTEFVTTRRSVTFYGGEEQRNEQTARYVAASDMEFVTNRGTAPTICHFMYRIMA